jgi:hypothetical protein
MKVLGWLAIAIAALSVLVGLSPVFIALIDEEFIQGGWAFLFFTLPVGAVGLLIAGVLAITASAMGLARGARLPGILGVVGMAAFVLSSLVALLVFLPEPGQREVLAAVLVTVAVLGYLAGLVGAVWAGFAARPVHQQEGSQSHE